MVERKKVKKKWCPTILKYNLLIYLALVLKKERRLWSEIVLVELYFLCLNVQLCYNKL